MRTLTLVLSLLTLSLLPALSQAMEKAPTLHAVTFYADWCNSCKILEPNIEKARTEYGLDMQNVLFTTFDLSNDATKNQSALKAMSLGLDKIYAANKGKTGHMLIIDSEGNEISKLTKTSTPEEIGTIIKENLK